MRRKPSSQNNGGGYNNQHRKPRYQSGGGGHHNHSHGHNRPRKNYSAMREKYLNQARDALAAGDRVLAENWFQHADHCYRMMVEEGYQPNRPQPQQQQAQQQSGQPQDSEGNGNQDDGAATADTGSENTSHLPSFITSGFQPPDNDKIPPAQNWEERDAN